MHLQYHNVQVTYEHYGCLSTYGSPVVTVKGENRWTSCKVTDLDMQNALA